MKTRMIIFFALTAGLIVRKQISAPLEIQTTTLGTQSKWFQAEMLLRQKITALTLERDKLLRIMRENPSNKKSATKKLFSLQKKIAFLSLQRDRIKTNLTAT